VQSDKTLQEEECSKSVNKILPRHIKLPDFGKDTQNRIDFFYSALMDKSFTFANDEEKSNLIVNLIHAAISDYLHHNR
jgi:hypothetical protein